MMSSLRFQCAAILVLGLSGLVAHRIVAQETPEEPATSEAVGELIVPRIDAPAPPPMTEEEAAASGAFGSSDFYDLTPPDMSAPQRQYRTCPDREAQPAWIEELEGFEVFRGGLVQDIYKARSYEQIVATGDCSCAVKAPPWNAAEAEYLQDYAALDLGAVQDASSDFGRVARGLYREVRRICREQGNW